MLDHLSIGVRNLERSATFYDAVLRELGYRRLWTTKDACGYGNRGQEDKFAIKQDKEVVALGPHSRFHIAFAADSREEVTAFFEAALKHGATDLGKPGLRPNYGENYFAAFVADLDGYRVEAVCHKA